MFRAPEQKILNEPDRSIAEAGSKFREINASLVQVGNVIRDVERTFHIVSDDNARHSKALLQPANQSVDAVRHYRIEA